MEYSKLFYSKLFNSHKFLALTRRDTFAIKHAISWKINNFSKFFVTLTVSLNYQEFMVAVSMTPPWLGVAQGGETQTNEKYGNYSFGVLYSKLMLYCLNFLLYKLILHCYFSQCTNLCARENPGTSWVGPCRRPLGSTWRPNPSASAHYTTQTTNTAHNQAP